MTAPGPAAETSLDRDPEGDAIVVAAAPLRLTFHWQADRWVHVLEVNGLTVAASVEWDHLLGTPDRAVSPAYQQATRQEGPEGQDVLLVGQWGKHHSSGVFQLGRTSLGVVLEVDVAVRSRAPLLGLAATYRPGLTSGDLIDANPERAEWSVGGGRLILEPIGEAGSAPRIVLAESGRGETRVQVDAPIRLEESTRRLGYRWRWERATGPIES